MIVKQNESKNETKSEEKELMFWGDIELRNPISTRIIFHFIVYFLLRYPLVRLWSPFTRQWLHKTARNSTKPVSIWYLHICILDTQTNVPKPKFYLNISQDIMYVRQRHNIKKKRSIVLPRCDILFAVFGPSIFFMYFCHSSHTQHASLEPMHLSMNSNNGKSVGCPGKIKIFTFYKNPLPFTWCFHA